MPEKIGPLPEGDQLRTLVTSIDERPHLAPWIARTCAAWALVEGDLMDLYSLVMGIDLPKKDGLPRWHPVALQIFSSLHAVGAKIDLLEVLEDRFSPDEFAEFRDKLKPRIWARFRERSKIAHGIWGTCATYPKDLILTSAVGGHERYQAHDFKQVVDRISMLHDDVMAFLLGVHRRLEK